MELFAQFWDLIVHLDVHLAALLQQYGTAIYALLFVAGALWAVSGMDAHWLALALVAAALAGDNVNYWVGRYLGPKVFHWEDSRFFNRKALDATHAFYEKQGGKTIIIA